MDSYLIYSQPLSSEIPFVDKEDSKKELNKREWKGLDILLEEHKLLKYKEIGFEFKSYNLWKNFNRLKAYIMIT